MSEIIELNARHLLCPMPVIRTQNALKKMTKGQRLKVYCTDPGVKHDIPAWCRIHKVDIVEASESDGEYTFILEVSL
ncbi:MAG: sulfurtransferase TusA family protein [Francisellaceae bacterium]